MASPSPTSEATAIPQTSPTFPHELTYNSAIKRKAYAAAAADARRKRRKALTRRKSGTMRKTTAAKPSSSDNEGKAPVAATSIAIVKQQLVNPITAFSPLLSGKRQHFSPVFVHPDIHGIKDIGSRLCQGESVAVPTECTYELLQHHQQTSKCSLATRSHIYIPDVSVFDTCSFWKQVLVKKSYAIKAGTTPNRCESIGSIGSPMSPVTSTIATFNESVQVVRRIAAKVWPGPVIIYIQVHQLIPGLTVTINTSGTNEQCYTSESNVQHYLALRKACHPLTVKVCQEFYNKQKGLSSSPNLAPLSTPPASPRLPPLRVASSSSLSLSSGTASSSSLSALFGPSTTAQLLVGSAMLRGRRPSLGSHTNSHDDDDDKCDTIEYVTVANDPAVAVSNVTAVLNGEERRETFAVPTCEHSQPWPVTIWIDADTRTVKLKTKTEMTGTRSSSRVWDQRKSPDSVRGGVSQLQTAVTESTLHQAIRSVKAVSNAKERVLQAVMLKWKVVAEHH